MKMQSDYVATALREDGVSDETIAKFLGYHRNNPEVWRWFEVFAKNAAESGKKLGAKAVMERVRWEVEICSTGEFAINNNYTSYFARVFAAKHPQFKDYFETRAVRGLKSKEEIFV
jgi:hypothetical protein